MSDLEVLNLMNSLLSDIGNFVLVIFGFTVTLFTVLYSFILSKREQLKEYSDRIKNGDKDPVLYQRSAFAKSIINRLKRLNSHLIGIISISFISYFLSLIIKYSIDNTHTKEYFVIGIGFITFLLVVYVAGMLFVTIKDYIKNTQI